MTASMSTSAGWDCLFMLCCCTSVETKSARHSKSPIGIVIVCVLVLSAYAQYVSLGVSPSFVGP